MNVRVIGAVLLIAIAAIGGRVYFENQGSSGELSVLQEHMVIEDNTPFQRVVLQDLDEETKVGFYKDAQNKDELYVFQNRVVLYRPSVDKIVDVAPYLGGEDFDPAKIDPDAVENLPEPSN